MKNIKAISFILIILVTLPFFAGCNLFFGVSSADQIFLKYDSIAEKFTKREFDAGYGGHFIVPYKSLFNTNKDMHITFKPDASMIAEINKTNSMFNVLIEEYPQTLYTAISYFNQYRDSLRNTANTWDKDQIRKVYQALLGFERALGDFYTQKTAIETIIIAFNQDLSYSYTTIMAYNNFIKTYDNLLDATIQFVKLFEEAYFENIANPQIYMQSLEVPRLEVVRVAHSSQVYMAEAVYNYYIVYNEGFRKNGADTGLYQAMLDAKDAADAIAFSAEGNINGLKTEFYRATRGHEEQVSMQSQLYVNAISRARTLKLSTKPADIQLYNDYQITIAEAGANYKNYVSFVVELVNKVNAA